MKRNNANRDFPHRDNYPCKDIPVGRCIKELLSIGLMKVVHPRWGAANAKIVQMSGGGFHVADLFLPRFMRLCLMPRPRKGPAGCSSPVAVQDF